MNDVMVSAILLTLKVALTATLVIFIPGILLGYYFARRNTLLSKTISTVVGLPMVLPPTAVGYLLLRLLAVEGPLGPQVLGFDIDILLTWKAAVLACAVMALPLVVRTAKVAFEGVDSRLEMMKRTLGFGPVESFVYVTVPLALKGLIAAGILGFTRAVGEFGATVMVAGNIPSKTQTLASAIFSAQQAGGNREAYILIILALILGFIAIFATELLTKNPRGVSQT